MNKTGSALPLVLPLLVLALPRASWPAESPSATLDRATVPAAGLQSAILTVSRFGRYAVTVASAQGTGLQIVDRMAGPGPIAGTTGEKDGRLDVFLERGEYKIVTHGHPKAKGEARLAVHAFAEKNAPRPPMLVELRPTEGALEDFEQVSYWIEVNERRPVALEAAGRSLADLRLWRDGAWLVDAAPNTQVAQPTVGQPLLVCRLTTTLEPGLYLLTAYGGPSQPWAEDTGVHPFHLRFGLPRLAQAGRRRFTVSPFGVDRHLVPGDATYFRLELPEARPAAIQVGWFDPDDPFAGGGSASDIAKNSVPPVADLTTPGDRDKDHVVTVIGAAGQPYVLQHFDARHEHSFHGGGAHWISTVHSGHPADSVDATAVLVRSMPERQPPAEPFLDQTVELDARTGWARRANLVAPLTLFLRVKDTGPYEVLAKDAEARVRIEPFFIHRPAKYEPPAFRGSGSVWDLDAGYYVLTAEPVKKGIVEMAIRPKGLVELVLEKLFGKDQTPKPVRAAARFPSVVLDTDRTYTLYVNQQPGVKAGLILRLLPLDLTEALAVSQQPGDTVTVPFKASEPGTLRAEAEDGSFLEVSADGGPWQQAAPVSPGTHTAAVRHGRTDTINYSLRLEPLRMQATTPLPALPGAALASLPEFPALSATPRHLDLARDASATFVVTAAEPGLYRLESTGLLATEGNLRTRTITSFARESQNGVGRNFLVQQYLREGDYQMTVAARELSAGHLGLALTRTKIQDGGFLTLGSPARVSLSAGEAVAYRFKITKPGEFRVRSLGLGRGFRCRLEDQQGWPVAKPGTAADVTAEFGPGLYRLVILPEATAARVITLIEPARRRQAAIKGHGPHRLPLARRLDHVWLEPEGDGERVPDVWELDLPAPLEATLELTGEMQANLVRVAEDGTTSTVAFVPPGRGWKGALARGRYRVPAVCARRNNRAPYQIGLWPEPLVAGLDRDVTAPIEVPISVGDTALVELSSFGSADVRARLYDSSGRLVAASDDRADDWNFAIARSLTSGSYRLRIDPVGAKTASSTVSMRVPRVVERPALSLPANLDVGLGRAAHVYPLALPAQADLLLVAARSAESIGVAIESSSDGGWRTIGSSTGRLARIEVPMAEAGAYRLRLWSLDRRGSPVRLGAAVVSAPRVGEAQLRSGVALEPVAGLDLATGVAAVTLNRPGLFRAEDVGLRWAAARGEPARPAVNGTVASTGPLLWVIGDIPAGRSSATARAARVTLAAGAAVQFLLPREAPAACDLAPSSGPLLVLASARGGQPGVSVGDGREADGRVMAVGTRAAVSVALRAERPAAVAWAASPASEPFEVLLEQWSFPAPQPQHVRAGSWDGALEGVAARAYDLPDGPKRLHLALGEGVVAVLSKGDAVTSVHWDGGESFAETVETAAGRLTLLHSRPAEDRFAIEVIPIMAGEAAPPLAPGASYERSHVRAGTARLTVSPGEAPLTLHVRGHRAEPVFVSAGGRVLRGSDLPADPLGGTLLVPHAPGLLLAWADRAGQEAQDLWSRTGSPEAQPLEPPASLALSGTARGFFLKPSEPVMLHLRTATPMATLVRRGDGAPDVEVHPRGGVLDAYLPAGPAELLLRAVAGASLSGTAEVTATPVTPIDEGLGPEVLLAPGATRLFSFTVAREGPVGIGVRAGSDVVEAVLLSGAGQRLGRGAVQMPTLAPGTYLLALHAPEDGAPVRARTALAGLKPPDTGPPEDVIRRYLEPEEAPPRFTAVRVEVPAEEEYAGEDVEGEEEPPEEEGEPEDPGTGGGVA